MGQQKRFNRLVVVVVILVINCSTAFNLSDMPLRRYCGVQLHEVLEHVCLNGYFKNLRHRRYSPLFGLTGLDSYSLTNSDADKSELSNKRQKKSQPPNECCYRRCSYEDLMEFCNNNKI